jgi:hypothetical protein
MHAFEISEVDQHNVKILRKTHGYASLFIKKRKAS